MKNGGLFKTLAVACAIAISSVGIASPAGQTQERMEIATRIGGGLTTTIFETPAGNLKVNLPDDASAGDTISGTVIAEPIGSTPEEKAQNEDELNGYVVAIKPKDPPPDCPLAPPCKPDVPFTCTIPKCDGVTITCIPPCAPPETCVPDPPCDRPPNKCDDPPTDCSTPKAPVTICGTGFSYPAPKKTPTKCQDTKVRVCTVPVLPCAPPMPPPGQCIMPSIGQCGQPIECKTPCDGKFNNSKCQVGGKPCKPLAESPRKMVCESPRSVVGPTTLTCQEGNNCATAPFCNVKIKLSCPKTVLHKGECSTVTCVVTGLDTADDVDVTIDNNSPQIVTLSGGNHQRIRVKSGGPQSLNRPYIPQSLPVKPDTPVAPSTPMNNSGHGNGGGGSDLSGPWIADSINLSNNYRHSCPVDIVQSGNQISFSLPGEGPGIDFRGTQNGNQIQLEHSSRQSNGFTNKKYMTLTRSGDGSLVGDLESHQTTPWGNESVTRYKYNFRRQ